ncbi:uncharacterized protein LOC133841300 [Drosophila sulfurigaster albostrigata]|uniref:uncharacterized protein LOC133841300 n=1 Tax=Drosophila sulfurigaster albostrigata TaxID=89887 RepID=UPI002D21E67A|nr:uncharacterized protein LOC133841300 [Drosophila sulfurigaster albostrigata]
MERLIELVEKNQLLYDSAHPDFKNNTKRNQIWDQIGLELGESGNEIKKKWRSMRDTFAKHMKTPSKPWIWADAMERFRPYMSHTSENEQRECEPAVSLADEEVSADGFIPRATSSFTSVTQNRGSDALDMLFLAYAEAVRQYGPRRRAIIKFKIAQVFMEEELADVDETSQ